MAYVYILQSEKSGRYYIGSTKNIQQRLSFHMAGRVKATQHMLPVKEMLRQEYEDIDTARKIERRLKELKRKDFISKIIKDGEIKIRAHSSVG